MADEEAGEEREKSVGSMLMHRLMNPLEVPCFLRSQCYGVLTAAFTSLAVFGLTGSVVKANRYGCLSYLVGVGCSFAYCYKEYEESRRNVEEAKQVIRDFRRKTLADTDS